MRKTSRHLLGELLPAAVQEVVEDVHGHGEDDGRVVLRRDAVQRLQVAQLKWRMGSSRIYSLNGVRPKSETGGAGYRA